MEYSNSVPSRLAAALLHPCSCHLVAEPEITIEVRLMDILSVDNILSIRLARFYMVTKTGDNQVSDHVVRYLSIAPLNYCVSPHLS